jgi:hypothetical protein
MLQSKPPIGTGSERDVCDCSPAKNIASQVTCRQREDPVDAIQVVRVCLV